MSLATTKKGDDEQMQDSGQQGGQNDSKGKNPNRVKGGKQAAKTNKERHGDDFYQNIGREGGKSSGSGSDSEEE
jgi:general stress protein YciG